MMLYTDKIVILFFSLIIFSMSALLLFGWVFNIIVLVEILADPLTVMVALRIVGIFVLPLGGVLGWI